MKSIRLTAVLASAISAIVLGTGLAAGAGAQGADAPCRDTTVEHLKGLGIEANGIKEINVVSIIGNLEIGNTVELQAWTLLKSCTGSLVVKMTPLCSVKETYSRGGCTFANVRHF
jgi:hypothetical protein